MRKKLLVVLGMTMMIGLSACGGKESEGTFSKTETEAQSGEEQDTADKDTVPISELDYYVLDDGTAAIVGCRNGDKYKTLIIPEEIDGYKVTAIGIPNMGRMTANILFNPEADPTYDGDATVEKLVIPDTVTAIAYSAIGINKNLKEVDLGNGVEVIEELAFGNTGIEKIELPESIKKLEYLSLPDLYMTEVTFRGENLEECELYFDENCVVKVPAGSKTEEIIKAMAEETGATVISE